MSPALAAWLFAAGLFIAVSTWLVRTAVPRGTRKFYDKETGLWGYISKEWDDSSTAVVARNIWPETRN